MATTEPTAWRNAGVVDTRNSPHARLRSVPVRAVTMRPGFWLPRIEANRRNGIPQLHRQLEDHGVLDNLRRISGRKNVERRGAFWTDSDLAKWMEGAAWVLQSHDDPEVRRMLEGALDDLIAIQREDGYIHSFFTGELFDQRFRNLPVEHELYCAGHIFQAAVAHYRGTGDTRLLDAASRYADFLTESFGPGKIEVPDGHPEVEMALIELYRATGQAKYLELAGYFLSLWKFAEKSEISGHSVRAGYLASGAADYYLETGDRATLDALERLWEDATLRKMYITGAIGSRAAGEQFGAPYELSNEHAYAETCASISSIFWNWRMLLAKGEARFTDVIERTLYNGFLSGVSLDGAEYFYVNPLANFRDDYKRVPWFDCTCCPTNVVRLFPSLPGYFYSTSDEGVWIHLFDNNRLDWHLHDGRRIAIEQETGYPWDGTVEIKVIPDEPSEFSVFIYVPAWCETAAVAVNNEAPRGARPCSYLEVRRTWHPGDTIALELPMPITLQEADPRVREDIGSVAIQRGPVVYCLESPDNPNVPMRDVELHLEEPLRPDARSKLLGGIVTIETTGLYPEPGQDRGPLYRDLGSVKLEMEEPRMTAIPYYAWANRGPSQMVVWIPYRQ